jgi:hypothetical protein
MKPVSRDLPSIALLGALLFAGLPAAAQDNDDQEYMPEAPITDDVPAPSGNQSSNQLEVAPAPTTPPPPAPKPAKIERTRLLVMDLKNKGADQDEVDTLTGLITIELSAYDQLDVLSGADIKRMVELEMEKQAAGCTDEGSCLAEIAGALGARLVVFGVVGKLGETKSIQLNLYDSNLAKAVSRQQVMVKSLEEAPDKLRPSLHELVKNFVRKKSGVAEMPEGEVSDPSLSALPPTKGQNPVTATDAQVKGGTPRGGPGMLPWVVVGAGVVLSAVGGFGWYMASQTAQQVADAETNFGTVPAGGTQTGAIEQGSAQETALNEAIEARSMNTIYLGVMFGGLGLGVPALVGGTVWALVAGGEE